MYFKPIYGFKAHCSEPCNILIQTFSYWLENILRSVLYQSIIFLEYLWQVKWNIPRTRAAWLYMLQMSLTSYSKPWILYIWNIYHIQGWSQNFEISLKVEQLLFVAWNIAHFRAVFSHTNISAKKFPWMDRKVMKLALSLCERKTV